MYWLLHSILCILSFWPLVYASEVGMRWIVCLSVCTAASLCAAYTIAPVTDDMIQVADSVISDLLPPTGVSQTSSTGWQRLAYICDTFGPRFSGSQNLENAFDYIATQAAKDGLRVTEEYTSVPKWVRGDEWYLSLMHQIRVRF
jgi:hypothetical protein